MTEISPTARLGRLHTVIRVDQTPAERTSCCGAAVIIITSGSHQNNNTLKVAPACTCPVDHPRARNPMAEPTRDERPPSRTQMLLDEYAASAGVGDRDSSLGSRLSPRDENVAAVVQTGSSDDIGTRKASIEQPSGELSCEYSDDDEDNVHNMLIESSDEDEDDVTIAAMCQGFLVGDSANVHNLRATSLMYSLLFLYCLLYFYWFVLREADPEAHYLLYHLTIKPARTMINRFVVGLCAATSVASLIVIGILSLSFVIARFCTSIAIVLSGAFFLLAAFFLSKVIVICTYGVIIAYKIINALGRDAILLDQAFGNTSSRITALARVLNYEDVHLRFVDYFNFFNSLAFFDIFRRFFDFDLDWTGLWLAAIAGI